MTDPFLTGLMAGAALGMAGLFARLIQLAAVAALALLAWVLASEGSEGLDRALADAVASLAPHGRLLAGVAVGAILAGSLLKAWTRRGA